MTAEKPFGHAVLAINSGSSSLKFAAYKKEEQLSRVLTGKIERIGLPDAIFTLKDKDGNQIAHRTLSAPNHADCVPFLQDALAEQGLGDPERFSHRVVHGGMNFREPQWISAEVLNELKKIIPFAPLHMPAAIALMEEFSKHSPHVPQLACFDTSFHREMPAVAQWLPIPRRYKERGIVRYGFHGISYSFLMQELERIAGVDAARGKVLLAHLGNGASMAAIKYGKCVDTTMAFTPAAGLVMSTRTGDLDPGVMAYLMENDGMKPEEFAEMVHKKSGLLGISETSPDTRDLVAREREDSRAAEALELFCHSARKWIGALAASMGGLDTVVFSAGIGENSPILRARICSGLEFLGIKIDNQANEKNDPVISTRGEGVTVRVIPTDEELFLAQTVLSKRLPTK